MAWLAKCQFMAITYRKIRTKNLLPTSAKAALANCSSPKYSRIKGKLDSPGANEGNSIISVLPFGDCRSILKSLRILGVKK